MATKDIEIRRRMAVLEEKRLQANEAQDEYTACKNSIQDLRARLQENSKLQPLLYNALVKAEAASKIATSQASLCRDRHKSKLAELRAAELSEQAARSEAASAEHAQQQLMQEKGNAEAALLQNERGSSEARSALARQQDELARLEILLQDRKGYAKASQAAVDELLASGSSSAEAVLRPLRADVAAPAQQALVKLPSWTTGKIWSQRANRFIDGWPHAKDPNRVQRFIVHLDTGNAAHTVISQAAFDFLGLNFEAQKLGEQVTCGVGGHQFISPVYQISYALDIVNSMKPGTIKRRTVKAAVIDGGKLPHVPGYFDLLLCAEDCRKFTELVVDDKSIKLEILDRAPTALYDRQPLITSWDHSGRQHGQRRSHPYGPAPGVNLPTFPPGFQFPTFAQSDGRRQYGPATNRLYSDSPEEQPCYVSVAA